MYPYFFPSVFGRSLPSYIVLIAIGIVAALVLYRILAPKVGISDKSFIFYGLVFIASIGLGFVFARLFQMLYNLAKTGKIGTGITFLGGLIGGVFVFFMSVLIFGKKYRGDLMKAVNVSMPCITIGHFFGRIGCFLAGCCHGKVTSFLGVSFPAGSDAAKLYPAAGGGSLPVYPTQLFEAALLLMLTIALILLILRLDMLDYSAAFYLYGYGIFRFLLEFLRGDERGAFLLGLSPSQIISIIMVAGAVAINILVYKNRKKRKCAASNRISEQCDRAENETRIAGNDEHSINEQSDKMEKFDD